MKRILKYEIPIEGKFSINMPEHCKILNVQMQNDAPYIWVLANTCKMKKRQFLIVGTGQEIKCEENVIDYVGTFQICDGKLAWHLFDLYYGDDA